LLRRTCRLTNESEAAMLRIYVNFFYPALILQKRDREFGIARPGQPGLAAVGGFGTIVLGFAVGYCAGRALGLQVGAGLRTFAFAVGSTIMDSFRSR